MQRFKQKYPLATNKQTQKYPQTPMANPFCHAAIHPPSFKERPVKRGEIN
jgi:hypothetical protein